jgi:hypothetical protein
MPPVLFVVPTVDASPGEVDDDIRAVDLVRPIADRLAVPFSESPRKVLGVTTENDDIMSVTMKRSCEYGSDLSCSARDYDFH